MWKPRWAGRLVWALSHIPHGRRGIARVGHRAYVGGMWDEIGKLQFYFLISRGLRPESYLLDIGCGSLRLGVLAIPYLQPAHYLGIDKEYELVRAGLEEELEPDVREDKRPNIVISDSFAFEELRQRADFAIAQSLFTHLPAEPIGLCLRKLHPWLRADGVFYATFFETKRPVRNPRTPHDHWMFKYTRDEMHSFGEENGFAVRYIGDWDHPRDQVMVEYRRTRQGN